ncbi:MAG: hypothetical protein FJX57_23855 [Alphaproteobacteria bacterium]|nr:hypothetical protein [Alphaproteobacteria bacterium]
MFVQGVVPSTDSGPVVRRAAFRSAKRSSATVADPPIAIPDIAEEAHAIGTVLGASPERDLYLGSLDMRNWHLVMFANRGLLAGDLDGLSEPALALSRTGESGDDGMLMAGEIMTLRHVRCSSHVGRARRRTHAASR